MAPPKPVRRSRAGGRKRPAKAKPRNTYGAKLILQLEKRLGFPVIAYYARAEITGRDIRPLYRLLTAMGKQARAAIVLQSPGGTADASQSLANLLHQYVGHLDVYVPTFANSAATLFACHADTLYMGPTSELSPIDPQVPIDVGILIPTAQDRTPGGDQTVYVPAHVIKDFLEFAGIIDTGNQRDQRAKVNSDGMAILLKHLNPWVIGWYERADKVSREYAHQALVDHLLKGMPEAEQKADAIVTVLLETYGSHEASIFRDEARRIGMPVKDCPAAVWKQLERMSDFYDHVLRTQQLGRILETAVGFHALHARPHRTCPSCKEETEVEEGLRYCPNCGKALYEQCRQCQQLLDTGWKFCPKCAAPVVVSIPEPTDPFEPAKSTKTT